LHKRYGKGLIIETNSRYVQGMTGECTYTVLGLEQINERRRRAQGSPTTVSNSIDADAAGEERKRDREWGGEERGDRLFTFWKGNKKRAFRRDVVVTAAIRTRWKMR